MNHSPEVAEIAAELSALRPELTALHRLLDSHRASAASRGSDWAKQNLDDIERQITKIRAQVEVWEGRLTCVECGATSDAGAEGWRTYLTDDDQPATYCPACAASEFGMGETA